MDSTITPAGWYDDGHGSLRWWDGTQWTTHTAPLAPAQTAYQQPTQPVRPVQPVQQPASALTYEQERNLVKVKRSKLAWILPLVFLLAAAIGALAAVAAWQGADPAPLKTTYREFQDASRSGDCAAMAAVTTQDFRDDLTEPAPFTCEAWLAQGHDAVTSGRVIWGARAFDGGILFVDESTSSGAVLVTYDLVRENGQWKLDERDTE